MAIAVIIVFRSIIMCGRPCSVHRAKGEKVADAARKIGAIKRPGSSTTREIAWVWMQETEALISFTRTMLDHTEQEIRRKMRLNPAGSRSSLSIRQRAQRSTGPLLPKRDPALRFTIHHCQSHAAKLSSSAVKITMSIGLLFQEPATEHRMHTCTSLAAGAALGTGL